MIRTQIELSKGDRTMNRRLACLLPAIAVTLTGALAADAAADNSKMSGLVSTLKTPISADDLRSNVVFLASEENGGRLTGSPGALRSARYIAEAFRKAGLQPFGGENDYFQAFGFTSGVRRTDGKNRMEILAASGEGKASPCDLDEEFRPLTYSGNGSAEGEVVFAGYGLVEPESEDRGYDSYLGLDVKEKIVLVLRDIPEGVSAERRQELSLYAGDRYKAKLAGDRGARAFLLVTGPNSANPGKLVKFRTESRTESVMLPAATISGELADRLLEPAGVKLQELQDALDDGVVNPHADVIAGARVHLETELNRVRGECRNVIGSLPPQGGSEEYVLIGAHYDHIGTGEGLGSMAREDEKGGVHYGADDNASGTSVVMELAAVLAEANRNSNSDTPRRGIIVGAWSGEELGLVGSSHFVNNPDVPLEQVVAYFNFDMVGRLRDNKLIVQSVGSSPAWRGMLERRNVPAGFNLTLNDDPYLPTDATGFYTKGVPSLAFFTDLHEEYNRPADKSETLNYDGMERIAKLAERLVLDSLDPALEIEYVKIQGKAPTDGTRMGRRAYTGTVPDFASGDVQGVKLADVRSDGPAAKAGLEAGDIIVEFAGQQIRNLQDYSDALVGAKIGQGVKVIVERDGKRLTFEITPTARPG
jgi:hypothetical protein